MASIIRPFVIDFPYIESYYGKCNAVCSGNDYVPFTVKRVFWIYNVDDDITRGKHAHHISEQVVIAVSGSVIVTTELIDGTIEKFQLDSPKQGLYIPTNAWHTMQYSSSTIQLVLASCPYNEADYIRDYKEFKKILV